MSQNQQDIISIDVVLKVRADDSTEGLAEDLLTEEEGGAQKQANIENFEEFVSRLDQQGLKNLRGIATNPTGLVQSELIGILGKAGIYGAVAAGIIAIVIQSPDIVIKIIEALGVKGGPLNQDYTRRLDEERQLGLDRDLQFRRAAGLDIIITTSSEDRGFILNDPAFIDSNLVDIETTRFLRTTSNETKYGYVEGL